MSHNIYSNQWLDQVFERKNKNYGAYNLRLHANENTSKALLMAVTLAITLVTLPFVSALLKGEQPTSLDLDDHIFTVMDVPEIILPKAIETVTAAPAPPKSNELVKPEIIEDKKIVDDKKPGDFEKNNNNSNTVVNGTGNTNDSSALVTAGNTLPTTNAVDTTIYLGGIELMPEFPGGEQAMMSFLSKRLKYPRQWIENNIKGTVYISFVIDKDGSVTAIKTLRGISVSTDFENEAKRVVAQMPKWKAGIQNGKNVSVYFTLPVSFDLK